MGGHGQRLGQALERLVEQDQAWGVGFEERGQLRGRRADERRSWSATVANAAGERRWPTQPVGQLSEQGADRGVGMPGSGSPAARAPPSRITTLKIGEEWTVT